MPPGRSIPRPPPLRPSRPGPPDEPSEIPPIVAKAAGELCGRKATSDVIDASIAVGARRARAIVVTSDPDDIRHLDSTLTVVAV